MGFHETNFSDLLSYGASSGPKFRTLITALRSGAEQRVPRWSVPRRQYNLAYGTKSHADISSVLEFAILRNGAENGFRIKDWFDYNSSGFHIESLLGGADPTALDQSLGTGDGTTTQFSLSKTYADGIAPSKTRLITKPRANTVLIAIDSVVKTEGVHYTVDTTSGLITFGTAPLLGEVLTSGFEFDVPVRFTKSVESWVSGTISDYNNANASLEAVEILDNTLIPTEFWMGGSTAFTFTADTAISILAGRVKVATASTTGLALFLPSVTGLPFGGPYFYIVGAAGTPDFDLRAQNKDLIGTITAGDIAEIILLDNGSWLAK